MQTMFRLASLRRKQSGAWGSRKAVLRDDVLNATGRRQEPFVYGSLPAAEFYFRLP